MRIHLPAGIRNFGGRRWLLSAGLDWAVMEWGIWLWWDAIEHPREGERRWRHRLRLFSMAVEDFSDVGWWAILPIQIRISSRPCWLNARHGQVMSYSWTGRGREITAVWLRAFGYWRRIV